MKNGIKMSRDGDDELCGNPDNVENSHEFRLIMTINNIKAKTKGGLTSGNDLIVSKKHNASVDTTMLKRTC